MQSSEVGSLAIEQIGQIIPEAWSWWSAVLCSLEGLEVDVEFEDSLDPFNERLVT